MRRERGQAATEHALVLSVLTVAILGASYAFLPAFSRGVDALSRDVSVILASGTIGDAGTVGGGGGRPGSDTNDNTFGLPGGKDKGDPGSDTSTTRKEKGDDFRPMNSLVNEFNTASDTDTAGNKPGPVRG